jgi:hypothetical protein
MFPIPGRQTGRFRTPLDRRHNRSVVHKSCCRRGTATFFPRRGKFFSRRRTRPTSETGRMPGRQHAVWGNCAGRRRWLSGLPVARPDAAGSERRAVNSARRASCARASPDARWLRFARSPQGALRRVAPCCAVLRRVARRGAMLRGVALGSSFCLRRGGGSKRAAAGFGARRDAAAPRGAPWRAAGRPTSSFWPRAIPIRRNLRGACAPMATTSIGSAVRRQITQVYPMDPKMSSIN